MYGCLSLVFPRPHSVCFLFRTSGIHISSDTMIYYDATSPISFYISRNEINNFTHVHVYLFPPTNWIHCATCNVLSSTNIFHFRLNKHNSPHFDHHFGVDVSASHHLAKLLKADLSIVVLENQIVFNKKIDQQPPYL